MPKLTLDLTQVAKEIHDCSSRLKGAGDALFKLAHDKAETEKNYRRALSIKIMELKDLKTPSTILIDLAKGDQAVSELMFQRDLSEAKFISGRENVNAIESQLSALQTLFKRFDEV